MIKKIVSLFVVILMLVSSVPGAFAAEDAAGEVIYVAVGGSDSALGTIDAPLGSLAGAQKRVRELKAQGIPVAEVVFRGGDYRINKANFTAEDSGTEDMPIVYRAYEGEVVNFKGSVELDMTKAAPVTDEALLSRMYEKVRNKVVEIDLNHQGITQGQITEMRNIATIYALSGSGGGDYNTVFVDEVEQPISQWPNGREYTSWTKTLDLYTIVYEGSNPDRWTKAKDWWIASFYAWDFGMCRISPIELNPAKKAIQVVNNASFQHTSGVSKRWKAYNLIEEIDLPGEYYIDRDNMKLYFYPPYTTQGAKVEFSVAENLLTIRGLSHVTFKNVNFKQCRGIGINLSDVVNVDFDGCQISEIGNKAYYSTGSKAAVTGDDYWQKAYLKIDGSYDSDVRNCVFDNIGSVGMYIIGAGNVDTLTPANNIIENNIITRCNQRSIPDGAMLLSGCGNIARNNHIGDSAQHAIYLFGNDHLVEDNEVYSVLREVADAGAIYQGRAMLQRGSAVKRNFIHDIWPADSRLVTGTCALYVDDGQQGLTFENNIVVGAQNSYNSNGGAAMKIHGNVFVDATNSWVFHYFPGNTGDVVRSTNYDGSKHSDTMDQMVNDIADVELYMKHYPDLADWVKTGKNPKSYTDFDGNIAVNCVRNDRIAEDDLKYSKQGYNPTHYTKDIFVDPENLDYRIKSDSIAAQEIDCLLTDANFDIEQIGLQREVSLNENTAPFRLLYPHNGSNVSANGLQLYWQDAFLADRYIITIATDPEFKNIVKEEEIKHNIYDVEGLQPRTTYFWKVKAKNTSRELGATWDDASAVYSFTTSLYEPISTLEFESAKAVVGDTLKGVVEGSEPGTFKTGTVDYIKSYIAKTEILAGLGLGRYTQRALDARSSVILNYFNDKSLINRGYVDLISYADSSKWMPGLTVTNSSISNISPNSTSFNVAGSTALSKLSGSVIYCFDMKLDYTTPEENWVSFGMSVNPSAIQYVSTNRGYYFIVKDGLVEMQKASGSSAGILETAELDIVDGNTHKMEFGIINTPIGCHVILNIDGKEVFDYSDTTASAPYDLGLEFCCMARNGDKITFTRSDSIPDSSTFAQLQKKADFMAAKSVLATFPAEGVRVIAPGAERVIGPEGVFSVSHAMPETVDGKLMMPIDAMAKLVGANVDGHTISSDKGSITFTPGEGTYLKNGYLMVPASEVSAAFGLSYIEDWLGGRVLIIDSGEINAANQSKEINASQAIAEYLAKTYPDVKDLYYKDFE